MSRRFGRNQKRAMRKQIEEANELVAVREKQLQESQMLGRRNAYMVEETAEVLGRYFVTLPRHDQAVQDLNMLLGDKWRMIPVRDAGLAPFEDCKAPSYAAFTEIVLDLLRFHPPRLDELRDRMHLGFTYRGKYVAYGIRIEEFYIRDKRDFIDALAGNMAHMMYDEMVKGNDGSVPRI